jgi:hypothetical protein
MKKSNSGISRRDFVTRTALVGAGLAVGKFTWAASTPKKEVDTFKVNGKMKTRKLVKLDVSEIGAGAMSISANYGPPADKAQGMLSTHPDWPNVS